MLPSSLYDCFDDDCDDDCGVILIVMMIFIIVMIKTTFGLSLSVTFMI